MITPAPTKGKVLVFGIAFWFPMGGLPYQFLHYVVGLRRLGYDVYYLEDNTRWGCFDPDKIEFTRDIQKSLDRVVPLFERYGLKDRWAYRVPYMDGKTYGMTDSEIDQLIRDADAFLNITGSQEIRDEHMKIPCRILIESDPVMPQIEVEAGKADLIKFMDSHTKIFSFGLNLHRPSCKVPTVRYNWLPTIQPVLMDEWANDFDTAGKPYTTVGTWENRGKDLVYKGETYYWSKHHEWLKFVDLPEKVAHVGKLEMASDVNDEVRKMLTGKGWSLNSAMHVSRDVDRYRNYIQTSRGEFTVAKDQNIRLNSGWFSDRDVCYMAAGRPVITQETGFSEHLPVGEGLFGFRTMDDVKTAMETIERDYAKASRRAREIAAEHFAAEKVLASLMERAGM